MKPVSSICAALALALCASGDARAAILWEQTFAADPGGLTSVSPIAPVLPLQDLYLQVTGGVFDAVHWESWDNFTRLWWDQVGPDTWILSGNDYLVFNAGVIHTGPTQSSFEYVPLPTFDHCSDPSAKTPGAVTCAQFDRGGGVVFVDARVATTTDFTLTLSDQPFNAIPEPDAWALMIVGFGALGMALRRSRRRATVNT